MQVLTLDEIADKLGIIPWDHQRRLFAKATEEIFDQDGKRICLSTCTGGGKTAVMVFLIIRAVALNQRVCLYTNRKLLCEQISGVLKKHGVEHGVIGSTFADEADPDHVVQLIMSPTIRSRVFNKRDNTWKVFIGNKEKYKGLSEAEAKRFAKKVAAETKKEVTIDKEYVSASVQKMMHPLPHADLVIIDEIHIQRGATVQRIIEEQVELGSNVATFTATPVGVSHLHDKLIIEGNTSELRKCGSLLPCHAVSPSEPDLSKIKTEKIARNADGEFTVPFQKKYFWKHYILGDVFQHWKKLNPDAKPTLAFAPDVACAVEMADYFWKLGVNAASIDADDVWVDGKRYTSDRNARADVLARYTAGDIKIIWNRFILREGIDLPETYCLILACMIGSVVSYVQTVGRLLRNHSSMDHCQLNDHGGNINRFFSPNADLDGFWRTVWDLPIGTANSIAAEGLGGDQPKEHPHRCRHCGALQKMPKDGLCYKCKKDISQMVCPKCKMEQDIPQDGFCAGCGKDVKTVRSRAFVQEDGQLVVCDDHIIKPKRIAMKKNTERLWTDMYYRAYNSRNKMTFRQAEGLFFYENYYYPPRTLKLMPQHPLDWFRKVRMVSKDSLL